MKLQNDGTERVELLQLPLRNNILPTECLMKSYKRLHTGKIFYKTAA